MKDEHDPELNSPEARANVAREMTLERKLQDGFNRGLTSEELASIKTQLDETISNWLGCDIPSEGTEDYDRWQSMVMDLDDCKSIEDFEDFLAPDDISGYLSTLDVDNILYLLPREDENDEDIQLQTFTEYYLKR